MVARLRIRNAMIAAMGQALSRAIRRTVTAAGVPDVTSAMAAAPMAAAVIGHAS